MKRPIIKKYTARPINYLISRYCFDLLLCEKTVSKVKEVKNSV